VSAPALASLTEDQWVDPNVGAAMGGMIGLLLAIYRLVKKKG
jgi:hypothetical protein